MRTPVAVELVCVHLRSAGKYPVSGDFLAVSLPWHFSQQNTTVPCGHASHAATGKDRMSSNVTGGGEMLTSVPKLPLQPLPPPDSQPVAHSGGTYTHAPTRLPHTHTHTSHGTAQGPRPPG